MQRSQSTYYNENISLTKIIVLQLQIWTLTFYRASKYFSVGSTTLLCALSSNAPSYIILFKTVWVEETYGNTEMSSCHSYNVIYVNGWACVTKTSLFYYKWSLALKNRTLGYNDVFFIAPGYNAVDKSKLQRIELPSRAIVLKSSETCTVLFSEAVYLCCLTIWAILYCF